MGGVHWPEPVPWLSPVLGGRPKCRKHRVSLSEQSLPIGETRMFMTHLKEG